MNLAQRIQARTDNGDTIVDFLVEVMNGECPDFKICHRLAAARLLTKYGCGCRVPDVTQHDDAIDFIADNPTEPSRRSSDSSSSDESYFDRSLTRVIRQSTDDGTTVCRFLINVMDGDLKAFGPQHRIAAARELLSRGFGKHASPRRSGEGRNPEEVGTGGAHSPTPSTQTPKSHKSPNPTNPGSDNPETETTQHTEHDEDPAAYKERWAKIWEEVTPIIEEGKRVNAEQEPDSDDPPYATDMSVFDEAWENSEKWFEEWKNSLDPEEYQAIIKDGAEKFDAKIDLRVERRKQIKKDQQRREKEEAERQAQQAKARAEAKAKAEAKEEEDLGPPPSREEHESWSPTPNIPTSFRLRNCGHPKCKLHDGPVYYPEDDRSSPYYNPGYAWPVGPQVSTTSAVFDDLMARRRPP